jgi:hypothetical protein
VVFDFREVDTVGLAFADEIFRVFANQHPEIVLNVMHANSQIKRMIERAKSGGVIPPDNPTSSNGVPSS